MFVSQLHSTRVCKLCLFLSFFEFAQFIILYQVEAGKTSIIDVCDQLLDPELIHGGTVSAAEIDGGVLFQRFHDLLFQNIVCVRNSHPNGRLSYFLF